MGKRDAQQVTAALMALTDARQALADDRRDIASSALLEAQRALESVERSPGVPIARAAERLGVSGPTIRSWMQRGALRAVPGVTPVQVEPASLRRVGRALEELRERGQDRDWLSALAYHLDDREARRSHALREGLDQLKRGEYEPA
jgi:hypothetical protein